MWPGYVCVLSHVQLFVTPWIIARQALLSMRFSRQEYWSGLHSLLQGIFLTQGSNPGLSSALQKDSLLSESQGNPYMTWGFPNLKFFQELNLNHRQSKVKNKGVPLTTEWLSSTGGSLVSFAWKVSFIKLPSQGRIFRWSQGSCAISTSQWPTGLPRIEWASARRWAHLVMEANSTLSSLGRWTKPRISESTVHREHVFLFPILLPSIFKCCMHACLLSHVRLFVTPWTKPARLLCLWNFPGKNTGVGCHFLP